MDMRKLVGRNVRVLRLAKSLSQEQLADDSGFSQQYISMLESGQRTQQWSRCACSARRSALNPLTC
jgi:transcriptional regulator with XRE-family HTH domain